MLRSLSGTTWLVLADMAELGEHTSDSHAHMGRYARDCGVKRLFAFGPQSSRAVETFGSGGEWFADVDSLIRRLQAELSPGVTVLIKGSRVNRLERVVQALERRRRRFRPDDAGELTPMLLVPHRISRARAIPASTCFSTSRCAAFLRRSPRSPWRCSSGRA